MFKLEFMTDRNTYKAITKWLCKTKLVLTNSLKNKFCNEFYELSHRNRKLKRTTRIKYNFLLPQSYGHIISFAMGVEIVGIVGPMGSGKTSALLSRVERREYAEQRVVVYKPKLDDRWGETQKVVSRRNIEHEAIAVESPQEILQSVMECEPTAVAIDEIQFFSEDIVDIVEEIANLGIDVYWAGLPLDFRGETFGSVPELLAKSTNIISLTAVCTFRENGEICGENASRTQRLINGEPAPYDSPLIQIGDQEYNARCIEHHQVPKTATK